MILLLQPVHLTVSSASNSLIPYCKYTSETIVVINGIKFTVICQ